MYKAWRCGQSTLLELFQEQLRKMGVSDDHIISINFEADKNEYLLNLGTLHTYVLEYIVKTQQTNLVEKTYVCLDEI